MSFKTIKVNPIFLSSDSSGFTAKNKTRKEKPAGISLGQSNNIKKKLIARIKNFQQNSKPAVSMQSASQQSASQQSAGMQSAGMQSAGMQAVDMDVFSDSVQFLDNLARDKEEQKKEKREKKNTSLKKKHTPDANAYMNIATELPPELNWDTIAPAQRPSLTVAPLTVAAQVPSLMAAPNAHASQWQAQAQPSYSNLKSGSRPTYRTWLRTTQKQKPVMRPHINILEDVTAPVPVPTELATTFAPVPVPTELATTFAPVPVPTELVPVPTELVPAALPNALATTFVPTTFVPTAFVPTTFVPSAPVPSAPVPSAPVPTEPTAMEKQPYTPSLKPRRKRITRTLKYKLGKHANGKVSVLIKNSQTRRKVQTEQALLKQKSILDIKNHLRSNNLLKVGSNAPNDVLRHLYEQSILAGQVENKAKETLLHNYFNEEKK